MTPFPFTGRSSLLVILSALSLSFCVNVTTTQHSGIEVKQGTTVEEKLQIAKSIVTDERLRRLKVQISERMPGISDAQLEGLSLRWNQTQVRPLSGGEARTTITVLVSIQHQAGVNGRAVVTTAEKILSPEVDGTSGTRPTGSQTR